MNFLKSMRYGMVGNVILYGGMGSIFGYLGSNKLAQYLINFNIKGWELYNIGTYIVKIDEDHVIYKYINFDNNQF